MSAIHPIPAFADNYIWALLDADSEAACVVDPGDPAPVLDYLQANGRRLVSILVTHHHQDHVGGLGRLIEEYQPVVYGPDGIAGVSEVLREGDEVTVFGIRFRVLEVPGHTLDHIAYFSADGNAEDGSSKAEKKDAQPILFCGDTLFAAGCGRLFEGTPEVMFASLGKLAALPPTSKVYCTHEYTLANLKFAAAAEAGNKALKQRIDRETARRADGQPTLPSNIALELATNPFLRCDRDEIRHTIQARTGQQPGQDAEVFAALRHWKDEF
ncbi:MAG: hydroxyacylglutathione hydrolase [Pseudohongiellaceae bacterium]